MLNRIVLFDMDGTLTESRKPFNMTILGESLFKLSHHADIGIITGSDLNYLQEQMAVFLNQSSCRYKTYLLPCNGTKLLWPPKTADDNHTLLHNKSMREELGTPCYHKVLQELILSQVDMMLEGIPLTGHFINCRGPLINWSPVGRNATVSEREEFIRIDKERNLRPRVLDELKAMLAQKEMLQHLTIKLGGDTSFDIYPKGWDKTYGLQHFKGWDTWFVGDRCGPTGNDYEIYEACKPQSFISESPEMTRDIIENQLIPMLRRDNVE